MSIDKIYDGIPKDLSVSLFSNQYCVGASGERIGECIRACVKSWIGLVTCWFGSEDVQKGSNSFVLRWC